MSDSFLVAANARSADASCGTSTPPPIDVARELKSRGNVHFQRKEWESAILCYTGAIDTVVNEDSTDPPSEAATFYANRAACHAKLNEHSDVIDDCTAALGLQPDYAKAMLRRALAREALEQPTEALEDAKKALELDSTSKEAAAAVPRLERASAAKLEKQKEEMMGQLKTLGNSFLSNFGLSTDNFKADKDPTTGSYNISFQK